MIILVDIWQNITKMANIYSFRYNRTVDDLRNNRMYIIQVSSTKDSKYNIAHPNIDQNLLAILMTKSYLLHL